VYISAGFSGNYYDIVTPNNISPRLGNIEACFEYYAIRELQVMYIPNCGTSTPVTVSLGYIADANADSGLTAVPTPQGVLESPFSMMTPAWQSASLTMKHTGTKLYKCDGASAGLESGQQGAFICYLSGASAATTYGHLYLRYTIDFYLPVAVASSVSRLKRESALLTFMARIGGAATARAAATPSERKTCADDEWEVPPSRASPTPSGAPGGSLYVAAAPLTKVPSRK